MKYYYNDELKLIYLLATKQEKSVLLKNDKTDTKLGCEAEEKVTKSTTTSILCISTAIDVYVPVPSFNNLNLYEIERLQDVLNDAKASTSADTQNMESKHKDIVLAIVDSNSTILYHRITKGLLDLDSLQ